MTADAGRPLLQVIVASTRPGRLGPAVARWFAEVARQHDGFAVEIVDLRDVNLPFFDEPERPRFRKYTHQHTRDWSARIERADAFAFVIPEYNHGYNAVVKNAIDFLFHEWSYKPAGLVSYGSATAGVRAQQMLKQVLIAVKMVPVMPSVAIPFIERQVDEAGNLTADDKRSDAAQTLLDELARYAPVLAQMRSQ